MEAGRAIIRGFVTPDRTTLITSTHRALAVIGKDRAGRWHRLSAEEVLAAAGNRRPPLHRGMTSTRLRSSATGQSSRPRFSGRWPGQLCCHSRARRFEAAIRAGGKGVEGSLKRAFGGALTQAVESPVQEAPVAAAKPKASDAFGASGPCALCWQNGTARRPVVAPAGTRWPTWPARPAQGRRFPGPCLWRGYLDRLDHASWPRTLPQKAGDLTREAAKYIANAMAI
jgi:indolepyruvate ferredoxin oxidoreductase, beta subunit